MRTLAGLCTTLCAAVMSFGVMAGAACSRGDAQNANGGGGEVRAMNNNSASPTDAGAASNSTPSQGANVARPDSASDAAAQKSQLDFKANIRREAGGEIVVEYSVTNRGARPVLLVNRGDTSFGLGPGRVYVEPQADGTVDLTQRGYTLPTGYSGPGPSAAVYPGVSELAPGKTASETVRARLKAANIRTGATTRRRPCLTRSGAFASASEWSRRTRRRRGRAARASSRAFSRSPRRSCSVATFKSLTERDRGAAL
jgi:hypothetical protein